MPKVETSRCKRGHFWTEWGFINSQGNRVCRICYRHNSKIGWRKYRKSLTDEAVQIARKRVRATYNQRHPNRLKARTLVNNAIMLGHIKREACQNCGAAKTEFHHNRGYDEPNWLVGVFLCRSCHVNEHNTMRLNKTLEEK